MRLTLAWLIAVVALGGASVALASPGTPPVGMSPVAGSVYKAQFGLCSLETINALAKSERVAVGKLTPAAAALRIAEAHEQSLGTAAVQGCRGGLLYRYRNDQAFTGLRTTLSQRITAEKYVAGAYAVIVIAFFIYVLIHAAKVARLDRELLALIARLDERDATTRSPASSS